MSVCLNHTDTEAVTRCAACGKPLCADCIAVSENNRNYCSQACFDRGNAAAERSAGVVSEKAATGKRKFLRSLIVFFLLIAIAAAGFMYFNKNGKKLNRKINTAIEQTKDAAKKTQRAIKKESQAIKKNLNTDSQYKRNREGLVK
jgi:uncharacterized protein HemX